MENGEESTPFDLTRDYPPLTMPAPLVLDVTSVRALMVEAAGKVAETETLLADKGVSKGNPLQVVGGGGRESHYSDGRQQ